MTRFPWLPARHGCGKEVPAVLRTLAKLATSRDDGSITEKCVYQLPVATR